MPRVRRHVSLFCACTQQQMGVQCDASGAAPVTSTGHRGQVYVAAANNQEAVRTG